MIKSVKSMKSEQHTCLDWQNARNLWLYLTVGVGFPFLALTYILSRWFLHRFRYIHRFEQQLGFAPDVESYHYHMHTQLKIHAHN